LISDGTLTPDAFRTIIAASAEAIFNNRDLLCELDGAVGDGDHGVTMELGWKAALRALDATPKDSTITGMCEAIADAFLEAVGASAGPLYSTAFKTAGAAVSDRLNLDASATVAWLGGMAEGIMARGRAEPGDKTMIDAWSPAVAEAARLLSNNGSVAAIMAAAADGAERGAEATIQMQSNRGRSKKLGARSVGHKDPGAASTAIMISAWAEALDGI
jgi:dihydroxyacetone kinase